MRHFLAGMMLVATLPLAASAQSTTTPDGTTEVAISELVAEPGRWDGERVSVVGELVGDFSARADGVWVQVNGDIFVREPIEGGGAPLGPNIGVGARIDQAAFDAGVVGSPGRYGRIGPIVELTGTFKHNDPELTGETFLEVDRAITLEPSRAYATSGADYWLPLGGLFMAVAAVISLLARRGHPHEKTTMSSR